MSNINEGQNDIPVSMPVQENDYVQGGTAWTDGGEAGMDKIRAALTAIVDHMRPAVQTGELYTSYVPLYEAAIFALYPAVAALSGKGVVRLDNDRLHRQEARIAELEAEVRSLNVALVDTISGKNHDIAELVAEVARLTAAPIPVNLPWDRLPMSDTDTGRLPRLVPLTRPSSDGGCNAGMSDAPAGHVAAVSPDRARLYDALMDMVEDRRGSDRDRELMRQAAARIAELEATVLAEQRIASEFMDGVTRAIYLNSIRARSVL